MTGGLPPRHVLLALVVVAVWGTNFVVITFALAHLPPLLFAALRFAIAWLPAAFFIRPPRAGWRNLAAYGVLIGVGQFGVLYIAMRADITPGLASLVVQTQAFFTIGLAMALASERVRPLQWAALAMAAAGIVVIGAHADASTTRLGLALTLLAAASWAAGNTVSRRAGRVDALGYVVWSSAFAVPPLLVLSWLFEGPAAIVAGLRGAGTGTWLAVAWQSVGNTLFGYGAWAWLLARHPAATVAPLSLLVPVFGMGAAAAWAGEPMPPWKWLAGSLVIGGLALNLLGARLGKRPG